MPEITTATSILANASRAASQSKLSRLCIGASASSIAFAMLSAAPAHAQQDTTITGNRPVSNPSGGTVTLPEGTTQTIDDGDNIELEDNTNDGSTIIINGTAINNDGDDEDVVIFVDNSEDDIVISIGETGVLQGVDGVIFYEGDGAIITNNGLIEGTGEATEAVVYFDRDADGALNTLTNNGTITSVGGATIGVDTLLGTDPSSGTVGDEEGIARISITNTGTISNTGDDSDADAIHFNGDPGTTGGEARGCLEGALVLCQVELTLVNSGTISAARDSSSNAAIRVEEDAVISGTITNLAAGQITGASNAITINGAHADHDLVIQNGGTITGTNSSGIWITGAGVDVINDEGGLITGGDEGIRIEGTLIDIDTGPSDLTDVAVTATDNTVTNSGTISGGDTGIFIGADAAGNSVDNLGTITGDVGFSSEFGGTLVNRGTVEGTGGTAITFTGTDDATVMLGADSTTTGAILFANVAANTLNIEAGASVDTPITGTAGTDDTVNLSGMGDGGELTLVAMDTLTQSGGDFTLSAATTGLTGGISQTGGILTVNGAVAGDADVGDGATFGGTGVLAGTLDVADGGTVEAGDGGVGTLTVGGLALSSNSNLNFDLDAPDTPGSSDRIQVNGDLVLDGTLNVSDVGNFGVGVYRLIDYTGSLTNNILDLGTLPSGFTVDQAEVQTSVGTQVNLVISNPTAGAPDVLFFDGAMVTANGTVDGGAGTWNLVTTNWTNSAGDANFAWNSKFAVFQNTGGAVVLAGDIETTGLQFAGDGYSIEQGTGTLSLLEAATVVRVDNDVVGTIAAAIGGGTNGLDKLDVGTLVLTGDNTYTGNTSVSGGVLLLDGSIAGDASVADGATLAGSGTAAGTVTLVDGARLAPGEVGTAGTLTVGGLALTAGSILDYDLGDPDVMASSDRIQVNGDLVLDGTVNITDIGGFGVGVYRLIDYTGTLTDNGLLAGMLPADVALDQIEIQTVSANQVNLVVSAAVEVPDILFWDGTDSAGDNEIDGGDGSWNLSDTNWTDTNGETNFAWNSMFAVFAGDTGTVTVDDEITFTGLQFMTDGYEIASGDGSLFISDAVNVRVDPDVTATISAAIGGMGGITKLDSGTLILDGDHTYTGDTVIDGGLLVVNDSIVSDVTINDGGTLGGSGTVGDLTVSGTVSPGNSIGTLNVSGDITFDAGSTYDVEVLPDGSSDLIAADGEANINGGTVNVLADGTLYNVATDYTILTADDGVDGTFDGVNSNLAFLTPTLSYQDEAVLLTLTRNDLNFAAVGANANQAAVGAAIQSQGNSPLANLIVNMDAATASNAFGQLTGELHPGVIATMAEDNRVVRNAVLDRLANGLSNTVWVKGWGSWGDSDGDGNAIGLSRDSLGVMLGFDNRVGDNVVLGLAGSYNTTDVELDNLALGEADLETLSALAYLGFEAGGLNARLGGGYSWTNVQTQRSVSFAGLTDSLVADYDGNTTFGFAELGYRLGAGSTYFEPFAGITYIDAEASAFAEAGGLAALRGADSSESFTLGTAGLRVGTNSESRFAVNARLGYQHLLSDDQTPTTTARFGDGNAFLVSGVPFSDSALFAGGEMRFGFSDTAAFTVSYDALFGSDSEDHTLSAGVTFGF